MSDPQTQDVLRPPPSALKGAVMSWVMSTGVPLGLRFHRWLRWNPRLGSIVIASRHDEVREVFLNDEAFRVPYEANLKVIMGGHPFFLSMDDTDDYRREVATQLYAKNRDKVYAGKMPPLL